MGGFAPGDLVFLGARPGIGKTAFGLECARKAATHGEGAVLVVSREMTTRALARRLVAQDSRIRATTLKQASLNETEQFTLARSVTKLSGLPLWLTDQTVSIDELTLLFEEIAEESAVSLLVVDYLQLMRAPKEIRDRRLQVEAISQTLKTLALQYSVPVLCLSSLSRGNQDDRQRPPSLSSLRESGELEHDADVILLLHRQYQDQETECRIAKNRDGRLGVVHLLFQSDYVSFGEASPYGEES